MESYRICIEIVTCSQLWFEISYVDATFLLTFYHHFFYFADIFTLDKLVLVNLGVTIAEDVCSVWNCRIPQRHWLFASWLIIGSLANICLISYVAEVPKTTPRFSDSQDSAYSHIQDYDLLQKSTKQNQQRKKAYGAKFRGKQA